MQNKTRKAVSKAIYKLLLKRNEFINCPNEILRLVRGLNIDSKEVDGEICMRGSDGKMCLSEKERGKVWKNYMERIMNVENYWDNNV